MRYLILLLLLAGCSQLKGPSQANQNTDALATNVPQSKSLFSKWSNGTVTYDLTGSNIGSSPMPATFSTGAQCAYQLNLVGSEISGNYLITGYGGTAVLTTPGPMQACYTGNGINGTYSISGSTLTMCQGTSCQDFQ